MSKTPTLFDMYQPEALHRPRRKRWGGAKSTKARAQVRRMLPAPCQRCGGIITPEDDESTWQAGHIVDRMDTEALGLPEAGVAPEHSKCNGSAGGKRGAQITNAKHHSQANVPAHRDKEPQWW